MYRKEYFIVGTAAIGCPLVKAREKKEGSLPGLLSSLGGED
jgi:hypothetical protein